MRCLTKGELITYETLIQKGPLSVVKLAKETRLYRTSLYQVIDNLISKGLVTKQETKVIASPPKILKEMITQEFTKDKYQILELEKIYCNPI